MNTRTLLKVGYISHRDFIILTVSYFDIVIEVDNSVIIICDKIFPKSRQSFFFVFFCESELIFFIHSTCVSRVLPSRVDHPEIHGAIKN